MHLVRVVAEGAATGPGDTARSPMDDESVEVFIAPAQHQLERVMQVDDGAIAADENSTPDQRADAAQDETELVHGCRQGCATFYHPAIVQLHASPTHSLPHFVPLSKNGRQLGHFPQAFTHLAMTNAIMHVIRAEDESSRLHRPEA